MSNDRSRPTKVGGKKASKKKRKKASPYCGDSLYVIELDEAIRGIAAFREANPNARPDRPCVYVGSTGLTPEGRFENHKAGIKAGKKYVTRFGIRLLPELYEHLNPLTREQSLKEEPGLAERLRKQGFAVWQH